MIKKFAPVRALTSKEDEPEHQKAENIQEAEDSGDKMTACKKKRRPWYIRIPLKFAINLIRLLIALALLSYLLPFVGKM